MANGVAYIAHNDVFTAGAGYLDIAAAVRDAKVSAVPAGTAKSPIAVFNPNTGAVHLVVDQTVLWGTGSASGSTALWGADNVYGQTAFTSGNTALWGANTTSGNTVLWGAGTPASSSPLGIQRPRRQHRCPVGRGQHQRIHGTWGANDPSAFSLSGSTALWGAGTPEAATALWGANSLDGSTVLWGRRHHVRHHCPVGPQPPSTAQPCSGDQASSLPSKPVNPEPAASRKNLSVNNAPGFDNAIETRRIAAS